MIRFRCVCKNGWTTGELCNQLNCKHGIYLGVMLSSICHCDTGWAGKLCDHCSPWKTGRNCDLDKPSQSEPAETKPAWQNKENEETTTWKSVGKWVGIAAAVCGKFSH